MKSINWVDCDRIDLVYNPRTKESDKVHVSRELVCDHPLVQKVWFVGYRTNEIDSNIGIGFEMVISGGRFSCRNVSDEQYENADIPEAEKFLKTLL